MGILPDNDIFELLREKRLRISPLDIAQIQPASVDLRLGNKGRIIKSGCADLSHFDENRIDWLPVDLAKGYELPPSQYLHAYTLEHLSIPRDLNAKIYGKNSLLLVGLDVNPAYINPGFCGHMPIAIKNLTNIPLLIQAGMEICQIEFAALAHEASRPWPEPFTAPDEEFFDLFESQPGQSNYLSQFLKQQINDIANK